MPPPITDRIARLKTKQEQLAVRLSALQSKAKTDERKRDTRRKIVVGAAVLAAIEKDASLAAAVQRILAASVTRPQDREVLGDLIATTIGAASSAPAAVDSGAAKA